MDLFICLTSASVAYVGPVAEGGVEGLHPRGEEVPDVTETGDFENLGLLLNNLSGKHKPVEYRSASRVLLYLSVRSYLCSAEKRLLGANSTGPLGRTVPLSLTH